MEANDLDRRIWLREGDSYGPNWDAAIEFGVDVSLLEEAVAKTYAERFQESLQMTRFAQQLAAARERLYGSAE